MVSTVPVYVIALVFAGVALLISAIISNSIKYEGGANPKDPARRKMWFWIIGILGTLGNLVFSLLTFYYSEGNEYAKSKLITAIGIGTGVCFIAYVILGFILSKMFKNGKLGNWF